jgi:hypothetical protein
MPPTRDALAGLQARAKGLWPGGADHCTCVSGVPAALAGNLGHLWQKVYGKKWLRHWHLLHLQHLTHLFGQIYYARFSAGGALCARAVPSGHPYTGAIPPERCCRCCRCYKCLQPSAYSLHTYCTPTSPSTKAPITRSCLGLVMGSV